MPRYIGSQVELQSIEPQSIRPVYRCSILQEDELFWILKFTKLTYELSSLRFRWTFRFYQPGNTICILFNRKIYINEYIIYFLKPDFNIIMDTLYI